jgi:hypothetical protein
VHQLFDTPWEELDVSSVNRFLADAGDEGLLWEAKGAATPRRDSVLKAVCGFANSVGGYLILGAERDHSGWTLTGASFPNEEPATWASSIIATGGVSPVPTFDAKPLRAADGRDALVIRVEAVATPPCITSSGTVYQRVSGQTLPVTDPRVMSDLIQQGAAVRVQTEAAAMVAAQRLLAEGAAFAPPENAFALALCAVGGPEDKAVALFNEERGNRFVALVHQRLQPDSMLRYAVKADVQQDCLRAWTTSQELGQSTTASAFWDGAAAVAFSDAGGEYTVDTLTRDVSRFWRALAEVVQLFGGTGSSHLAVLLNPRHAGLKKAGKHQPHTDVRRWTEATGPTDDEIASVVRELERGFGRQRWEPSSS